MQLRSGHVTEGVWTIQEEEALRAELYPTPSPEKERQSAAGIKLAVKQITSDPALNEEDRLWRLHRMLELCATELDCEVREYQAAHRHLEEHENRLSVMLSYPDVPEKAFDEWDLYLAREMKNNRSKMKLSRANVDALQKVCSHIERKVKVTEGKVASDGKNARLVRQSEQWLEKYRDKLALDLEEVDKALQDFDQSSPAAEEEHSPEHLLSGEIC
ncbi:MAG: hypothetical protein Q9207_002613 [Kuettlingeria erythrocarpa]